MSRLTCHCLNVAVNCKAVSWDSRPVDGSQLLPENSRHRLRHASLYEVELDLAGIAVVSQQSCGDTTHTRSDWECVHVYIACRPLNHIII